MEATYRVNAGGGETVEMTGNPDKMDKIVEQMKACGRPKDTTKLRAALGNLQRVILAAAVEIDDTGIWEAYLAVSDELKALENSQSARSLLHEAEKHSEGKPSDFLAHPTDSIFRESWERLFAQIVEQTAVNIMKNLADAGNVWRLLTWEEYKTWCSIGGNFAHAERSFFDKAVAYTQSAFAAKQFSPVWAEVTDG